MSKATDEQTRRQIERLREETRLSLRDIAKESRVSVPTVQKILKKQC